MTRVIVVLAAMALAPSLLWGQSILVVITGIGGEPHYTERFHTWAATLMDAAVDRFGLADSNVVYLAAAPELAPERTRGRSTKDVVVATLSGLADSLPPDSQIFIVVIGHGSYRNGVSKINLPGPDLTSVEVAALLDAFGDRPLVFANLTSASGEFVEALSGTNRVIITATKSGMERNASLFGQFFVAAFVGSEADANNDQRLSILEAFTYANVEVARAYEREQKLLSEHAVLDDNGDGKGSPEPGVDVEDGRLAAVMMLSGVSRTTAAGVSSSDSVTARLYGDKARLEQGITDLRRRKETLTLEEYEDQLEELLVALAAVNRDIRLREES